MPQLWNTGRGRTALLRMPMNGWLGAKENPEKRTLSRKETEPGRKEERGAAAAKE
jgi:hypothetical protein